MPHPNIFNAHSPPINTQQSCSLFHIWWKLGMVTNYSAVNYLLLLWSWLWLLCQTHSFIHLLCLVRWTFWRSHRLLHMKNGCGRKRDSCVCAHMDVAFSLCLASPTPNGVKPEPSNRPIAFIFFSIFRYFCLNITTTVSFTPQIC